MTPQEIWILALACGIFISLVTAIAALIAYNRRGEQLEWTRDANARREIHLGQTTDLLRVERNRANDLDQRYSTLVMLMRQQLSAKQVKNALGDKK